MQSKTMIENRSNGHQFDVSKTVLDNGLVVVTEKMSQVRSVSFGVFLKSGSRHESLERHGLTHFIEHALFKGTRKRSAAQIAAESDALGGYLDAFTGREIVGFYNKVLDQHLPRAFELIADLVINPAFDAAELEKEHNVILEEIKMVEDTPDDIIFDIFCENYYPQHSLGRPILGTEKALVGFTPQVVKSYYSEIYQPGNLVIAAAGNLEHEQIVDLAAAHFGALKSNGPLPGSSSPVEHPSIILRHKSELEQSHLVIGAPCPSAVSEDRYTSNLMTLILGGGMSSRLFQSVREDLGLVYTIFSSTSPFTDCGYLSIYAGASTEHLRDTVEATLSELHRIKEELVGEEELRRNQDQLKASLMLNLESTSSRMSSLATMEMNFGRFISPDEVIDRVDSVTAQEIQLLARRVFQPENLAVTVLGRLDGFELESADLKY